MSKMVTQNLSTNQLYTGFILTKSMRVRCAVWKLIQLLSTKPKKLKKKSSTYWMVELDGGMMRKAQWTSGKNFLIGPATKQLVNFWLHRTTCCSVAWPIRIFFQEVHWHFRIIPPSNSTIQYVEDFFFNFFGLVDKS